MHGFPKKGIFSQIQLVKKAEQNWREKCNPPECILVPQYRHFGIWWHQLLLQLSLHVIKINNHFGDIDSFYKLQLHSSFLGTNASTKQSLLLSKLELQVTNRGIEYVGKKLYNKLPDEYKQHNYLKYWAIFCITIFPILFLLLSIR